MIRSATSADAESVCAVYNPYVLETAVTFEEEAVSAAEMSRRIDSIVGSGLPYLAYEDAGRVLGYAYASKWRERSAYRFSVESTVYLRGEARGRGVGSRLYARLLEELRGRKIHAVMGGIALPNQASVALHEKFGFRKIAHFSEVGYKFGAYVDVGYWELIL